MKWNRTHRFLQDVRRGFCILIYVGVLGLTSCGGGGGEDGRSTPPPPPPPPPPLSRVSGHLIVPPHNTVEVEPNHTIIQAQALPTTATVFGTVAVGDAGFPLPGLASTQAEDLYLLNASGRVRITLTIAEDDLQITDLDLILMDEAGNFLDASEGFVATEMLETPGAGTFLVGVRAFDGGSAYVLSCMALDDLTSVQAGIVPPGATFIPGEILVKFRADKVEIAGERRTTFAATQGLVHLDSLPPGVELFHVSLPAQALHHEPSHTKLRLPTSEENALQALTIDTIRRLRLDPDVEYAEPNFLRQVSLIPNDEFFTRQWHYQLINLPQAWDITTGSDEVIVAVIDTGVLVNHPDLQARLTAGFDFISDPVMANDNDGIDADANDSGDDPRHQSSSFHGTHVAGTIGAVTNNATGVAGVTWQTRIMPLRVLGTGGATDADIAQAIRYAAGLPNSSSTLPSQQADIINMSLGGPGFSQTVQDAILAARAQGVIVVAAAGNDNVGTFQSPASLEGVISVAAVDLNSTKAPYSNFGPGIDVAAPGGDENVNLNGDEFPDGVLSTLGNDQGELNYRTYAGTSMAAPHVAGVLALMLAVNPKLTPIDIDLLLAGSHSHTPRRITRDLGLPGRDDLFGHGLIDAAAAVAAAHEIPGGQGLVPGGSILAASTGALDFDNFLSSLAFEVSNAGVGTLTITNITDDAPWLTLTPTSGAAPFRVTVTVDRTGLTPGLYQGTITIASNASQGNPTATIGVEMLVGGSTLGDVGTVFVLVLTPDTLETVAQTETTATQNYDFSTPALAPGTYIVVAGTDRDDDDFICDIEDACGFFPDRVTIVADQETHGVNFPVGNLIAPQSTPEAPHQGPSGHFQRLR